MVTWQVNVQLRFQPWQPDWQTPSVPEADPLPRLPNPSHSIHRTSHTSPRSLATRRVNLDQLQFNPKRDIETDAESEKASVTQNLKCKYIDGWFPRGNQSKEIGKFKQRGVKRTSDLVCVQSHICLLLKVRNLRHSLSDLKIFSAHR